MHWPEMNNGRNEYTMMSASSCKSEVPGTPALRGEISAHVSALSGGIQLGMVFAAVTGVAVLVLAFFMPGRESAGQGHGPELEGEDAIQNDDADRPVPV